MLFCSRNYKLRKSSYTLLYSHLTRHYNNITFSRENTPLIYMNQSLLVFRHSKPIPWLLSFKDFNVVLQNFFWLAKRKDSPSAIRKSYLDYDYHPQTWTQYLYYLKDPRVISSWTEGKWVIIKLTSKWGCIVLFALAGGHRFTVFNGATGTIIKQNSLSQMGFKLAGLLAVPRR